MEAKKLYFMDCHMAGRMYHDADEVWADLKVGTILRLERDKDNCHDVNAVAVVYSKDGEEYKIGYIPRGENETLASFLKWDGTTSLSAASARLTKRRTQRSRYTLLSRLSETRNNMDKFIGYK